MNESFIVLYAIILLVSHNVYKKKYGYQFNATFLTTAVWCVFAIMAVINPTGLRQPSSMVHVYSITFLPAFNVFCYLMKIKDDYFIQREDSQNASLKIVNYRIAIIEVMCLAILSPLLILGIRAIQSGNAGDYHIFLRC